MPYIVFAEYLLYLRSSYVRVGFGQRNGAKRRDPIRKNMQRKWAIRKWKRERERERDIQWPPRVEGNVKNECVIMACDRTKAPQSIDVLASRRMWTSPPPLHVKVHFWHSKMPSQNTSTSRKGRGGAGGGRRSTNVENIWRTGSNFCFMHFQFRHVQTDKASVEEMKWMKLKLV